MHIDSGNLKCWPRMRFYTWACAVGAIVQLLNYQTIAGVTPESPEVQKLVKSGLAFLELPTEDQNAKRLGGKCLMALAFLKAGQGDHARIAEAVEACNATIQANPPDDVLDVYSNGLAVIFLCELSPKKFVRQIDWYLGRLKKRQKDNGGWGYAVLNTGDTSQTQYGALSYWEANRRGFSIDGMSVDKVAEWLLLTQGPDGCWGYQGIPTTTDKPVEQHETNCSMLAAGLGSLYICADLFGMHPTSTAVKTAENPNEGLPAALRPVDELGHAGELKHFRPQRANATKILQTICASPRLDGPELQNRYRRKSLLLSLWTRAL